LRSKLGHKVAYSDDKTFAMSEERVDVKCSRLAELFTGIVDHMVPLSHTVNV